MNKTILAASLSLLMTGLHLPLAAEVLTLPATTSDSRSGDLDLPARGTSRAIVLNRHGEPVTRHPSVGGGSLAQPQITRWDYPEFSVVFENDHVVHTVVPDRPAQLFNTDELRAAGG